MTQPASDEGLVGSPANQSLDAGSPELFPGKVELLSDAEAAVASYAGRQQAKDRSWIARVMVGIFATYVLLVVLFVGLGSLIAVDWQAPAEFLGEILKAVMLPILTLVLGYYFGSSEKR